MPRHAFDRLGRLSLDEQYAVDQLCTRFESSLRAGESPSPEDYLESAPAACRPALLGELVALELDSHRREGKSFDRRTFVERFPDLAAVIDELLGEPRGGDEDEGCETPFSVDPADLPQVEGYNLIAEIGRGGMGVVYKARHRTLGRLVALKMILAGDFADERHLTRFLDEGAILARLQHPHIVQVFDFGHQDGRPFLALEYVEGGSLSAWPGRHSLGSREGARLVETLARAVHFAHRKGIIHRDLKPANILLHWLAAPGQADAPHDRIDADANADAEADDETIDPRLPIPKITDFGLARCDDGTRSLTQSGLVVGTPSYMSPEQALNERSIGPATDVYSLGAILYDLLVGRPPFRAETPLETVNLVLERDPPRPSKWQPGLPQDLETICLKCLDKDPDRRYASAEALADDLRRWRQGKPILARPVGPIERVGKWCRRQPMLAALIATVILLAAALAILATAAAFRLANERNEALAQRERAGRIDREHKLALVGSLMSATPDSVRYILETLRPAAALALPILRRRLEDRSADAGSRIRAAIALSVLGDPQIDFLLDSVPHADQSEGGNLALAFRACGTPALGGRLLECSRQAGDLVIRARYAILLLELGDLRGVRPMLAASADPNPRSTLIDQVRSWHGDLAALPALLLAGDDEDCQSGLCAAAGRLDPTTLSPSTRRRLAEALTTIHRDSPSPGAHAAAGWALRQWRIPLPELPATTRPAPSRRWFVNSAGLTMVAVEPGGLVPSPTTAVLLTRRYFLSDREVTIGVFRRFLADRPAPGEKPPPAWEGPTRVGTPEADCPANNVTRLHILLFCNWLSRRDGRRPCYTPIPGRSDAWRWDTLANGYRLPTEAEWDHAQRVGSTAMFFFGDDPRWLPSYSHVSSLRTAPGGSKLPSRWGLFDMSGNVWEHCWDNCGPLPPGLLIDPRGPNHGASWVQRGGAFDSGSYDTVSGFRIGTAGRAPTFGFRVACNDGTPQAEEIPARRRALDAALAQFPNQPLFLAARAELDALRKTHPVPNLPRSARPPAVRSKMSPGPGR